MRKTRLLLNIALGALAIASCSINGQGSGESASSVCSSGEPFFSSKGENEDGSSDASSSLPSSSSHISSLSSLESSSDNKVYFTVSIYQSYLIADKGVYGNPRFDFAIKVESGQPLYSTVEEQQSLEDMCRESYRPNGGAYHLAGFYLDEACRQFITPQMLVESDMNAYYHCEG